jgi:1-aminocyclopropane-1-carboxylate deaminase/D-cysteine desulfhydrase-like pyridoxal-dependent ACC family enzyme
LFDTIDIEKAITQKIELPFVADINLYLLRLDLIDEEISGNKWFKLKNNLVNAFQNNKKQLITFGGAYSNHIAATAKACYLLGIKSIGIIRGEKIENHTLQLATNYGMELRFVSRTLYKDKHALENWLSNEYSLNDYTLIPEGGANTAGIEGCKEIVSLIKMPFDFVCASCGTGTTLAGIVQNLSPNQTAIGFSALKGGAFLKDEVAKALPTNKHFNYSIIDEFHFGGYAKYKPELLDFIQQFYYINHIKLDFIYTAKMMYGLFKLIQQNYFPVKSNIVAIHSGGLQGNKGIGI